MDTKDLETWIQTDEGRGWLDSQKAPLIAKRDELLGELKAANGRIASEAQRAADTERALVEERKAIERAVVDSQIANALKAEGVFDSLIPGTIAALKEAHGLQVQASGEDRKLYAQKLGKEVGISDVLTLWKQSPDGKAFMGQRYNTATPRGGNAARGFTRADIGNMTADEILANLSSLTSKDK